MGRLGAWTASFLLLRDVAERFGHRSALAIEAEA